MTPAPGAGNVPAEQHVASCPPPDLPAQSICSQLRHAENLRHNQGQGGPVLRIQPFLS